MDALALLGVVPHWTERFYNGEIPLGITYFREQELRWHIRRSHGVYVDGT